jgi:hypothetical protein
MDLALAGKGLYNGRHSVEKRQWVQLGLLILQPRRFAEDELAAAELGLGGGRRR